MTPKIPVRIVTGFLGSGKTSLINDFLKSRPEQALVLVNEIGLVSVDHALMELSPGQTALALPGGCLCCTYRGELALRLREALAGPMFADNPPRRIIIETSGLASPVELETAIMGDPDLAPRLRFSGVIVCVDGIDGDARLTEWREAQVQLALADTAIVTKTDHPEARIKAVLDALVLAAPGRTVHRAPLEPSDLAMAFEDHGLAARGRRWVEDGSGFHGGESLEHSKLIPAIQSLEDLDCRLRSLCAALGANLIRLKGFVAVEPSGDLVAVQIVGGRLYPFVLAPRAHGASPLIVALTGAGGAKTVNAWLRAASADRDLAPEVRRRLR